MFYDPLGLISPITLPIKFILQKLFEFKFEWDTNILMSTLVIYGNNILKDLNMSALSVNRQMLCCERIFVQLDGFCDSSEKAYCAIVYIRVLCSHGVKVTLWSGRSRVASAKGHSIPRFELMACVLLGRLMADVKKTIEKEIVVGDQKVFCWSDSMVSLWWIKQVSKKWKVWMQNRVLNIRKLVRPERWF